MTHTTITFKKVNYLKVITFLFLFIFTANTGKSQFLDSLQLHAGTIGTFAKEDYQPLWLVSNRFGAVTDQRYDASTYAGFSNIHWLGKKQSTRIDSARIQQPTFYIKYGANLINYNHLKDIFLQEGYIKTGYKNLEIRFGRFKELLGESDKDLSSGSFGISGNAIPIPKMGIALTNYVNVPFTKGWLQVKGQLSHGWYGSNRYIKDAWYHEKTLYLRGGKGRFKFFAGAQHFVEWAGHRDSLQLDKSLRGFMNVLVPRANASGTGYFPAGLIYGPFYAGDQRGLFEFGFDLSIKNHLLHLYHQTPFEGSWGVNIKNIDNLTGISVLSKNATAVIKKILFEFIYTKQMESYAPPSQRQTYYNNGFYQTGWEYNNRIVGTPLFINRFRAQDYTYFQQINIKPFGWDTDTTRGNSNIIFSQIIGGNIGLLLRFSNTLAGTTKLTYTSGSNVKQLYTLQELHYNVSGNLKITAGVGFDTGDFTKNVGGLVGVHWHFKKLLAN